MQYAYMVVYIAYQTTAATVAKALTARLFNETKTEPVKVGIS
jgi:hypothetical protein